MVFPQPNGGNLLEMCLFISWELAALHPCCSVAADPCAQRGCAGREWQQRWKDSLQQQDRKTQPGAGAVRTGLKTGCVTRPEGSTQCSYSGKKKKKHCHKVTFWQRHWDLQCHVRGGELELECLQTSEKALVVPCKIVHTIKNVIFFIHGFIF